MKLSLDKIASYQDRLVILHFPFEMTQKTSAISILIFSPFSPQVECERAFGLKTNVP
jgi:hypothetical protein